MRFHWITERKEKASRNWFRDDWKDVHQQALIINCGSRDLREESLPNVPQQRFQEPSLRII